MEPPGRMCKVQSFYSDLGKISSVLKYRSLCPGIEYKLDIDFKGTVLDLKEIRLVKGCFGNTGSCWTARRNPAHCVPSRPPVSGLPTTLLKRSASDQ